MIFTKSPTIFESNKERNLYYKIFGGYLCNEFIEGYDERIKGLISILSNPTSPLNKKLPVVSVDLDPNDIHISFDNHSIRFGQITTDHGEFADILIQSPSRKNLVAIEAKLHSDWNYDDDIKKNINRHIELKKLGLKVSFYLLIRKESFNNALGNPNSRLRNLPKDALDTMFIFWEDILDMLMGTTYEKDKKVHTFLSSQIYREYHNYVSDDNGWLIESK